MAFVAGLASQCFDAFFCDDRHHNECRDRVSPPESEERVQTEAAEETGVRTLDVSPSEIRLVTHLDVPPDAGREVPRRFAEALHTLAGAAARAGRR